jgi:DNA-binding transcriptional LysR family regulator
LADCGSFSEVAKAQEISQPAVTFRVAKLESMIGLRLFARNPDGIRLTREGEVLLDQARRILMEHDALKVRMGHFVRESRGRVKMMIDRSETGERLVEAIAGDPATPAGLEVVRPERGGPWDRLLREQAVDIAVTGSFLHAGDQATLQRYDLGRQRGSTVAWNRDYFDFDPAGFRFPGILRSTILVPGESLVPGYLPFLEKWCLDSYGLLPPDVRVFEDEASAREACLAGLGVLVFPGDAERRLSLARTGLGIVKTFEFLLPDAYSFSLFIRAGERQPMVLNTAMKVSELFSRLQPQGWET